MKDKKAKRIRLPVNVISAVGGATLIVGAAVWYKECRSEPIRENYFTKSYTDAAYNATFRVHTTVTLEEKVDDDDDYEKSWFGSGTLLLDSQTGDNYIFTAEHLTSDGIYESKKGELVKIQQEKITVETHQATIFKEDEENDLALLKLNGSLEKPFIGKIAQGIKPGDYVMGLGFPSGNKEIFVTRVEKTTSKATFLDIFIIGGNSGGGVYLITKKELQLCGAVTKRHHIPSLENVREFFKGTPLEDDYL